ncbi:MAG: AI-2E family transporter [Candidatus Delongbacteria bacterium]|nr:AI-2E family transporter [Candidatus Delongbacteria bacterium]MCG2759832.1 AI-2E family transporter [Candidatus Delongbacteria bacterium]
MKNFKISDYFFLGFLLLISFSFINLIVPFIIDIFLAIVLYIIFRKPFAYALKKTKSRKKASVITVILVILVVAIPLFFVGMMVSVEASENYRNIKEQLPKFQEILTIESLKEYALKIPVFGEDISKEIETINPDQVKEIGANILMSTSTFVLKLIQTAFFNLTSFIMHLFITPFILFFLFLDSKKFISKIRSVLPLEREDEKKAVGELVKITDTIIIYTFLIGVAEGTYGGAMFSIMGIGSPFFWGVIMVVLSMIPIVGANTIIAPAAIIQILMGNYTKGVILLVLGSGLIVINQNIIKPKLAGDRSGLHPVVMFVATIGGIAWLGMVGFLVGPLIAALTIVSWELFAIKFKAESTETESDDI